MGRKTQAEFAQFQASPHRALGIVFPRAPSAKDGQDAVARILEDPPTLLFDDFRGAGQESIQNVTESFRVQMLAEFGRPDNVEEAHRRLFQLGVDVAAWCRALQLSP